MTNYKIKDCAKFEKLRQTYGWIGNDRQIEKDITEIINRYKYLSVELDLLTEVGVLESEVEDGFNKRNYKINKSRLQC